MRELVRVNTFYTELFQANCKFLKKQLSRSRENSSLRYCVIGSCDILNTFLSGNPRACPTLPRPEWINDVAYPISSCPRFREYPVHPALNCAKPRKNKKIKKNKIFIKKMPNQTQKKEKGGK